MILVIAGSGNYPYPRLLDEVDRNAKEIDADIIMQTGPFEYKANNCRVFTFVSYGELIRYYQECELVIAHVSSGPFIYARKYEKPIVGMPRRKDLGEAVADHQVETAAALKKSGEPMQIIADDEKSLSDAIRRGLGLVRIGAKYQKNNALNDLVSAIREAI